MSVSSAIGWKVIYSVRSVKVELTDKGDKGQINQIGGNFSNSGIVHG